ncbi:MAG: hypothetical protein ACPGEG_10705 [Salibacteraceae bacterium]
MAKNKNNKKGFVKKVAGGVGNALLQIAGAKNKNDAKRQLKRSLLG